MKLIYQRHVALKVQGYELVTVQIKLPYETFRSILMKSGDVNPLDIKCALCRHQIMNPYIVGNKFGREPPRIILKQGHRRLREDNPRSPGNPRPIVRLMGGVMCRPIEKISHDNWR